MQPKNEGWGACPSLRRKTLAVPPDGPSELVRFFRDEELYWGEKGDYEGWSTERAAIELIRSLRASLLGTMRDKANDISQAAAEAVPYVEHVIGKKQDPFYQHIRTIIRALRGAVPSRPAPAEPRQEGG